MSKKKSNKSAPKAAPIKKVFNGLTAANVPRKSTQESKALDKKIKKAKKQNGRAKPKKVEFPKGDAPLEEGIIVGNNVIKTELYTPVEASIENPDISIDITNKKGLKEIVKVLKEREKKRLETVFIPAFQVQGVFPPEKIIPQPETDEQKAIAAQQANLPPPPFKAKLVDVGFFNKIAKMFWK